MEENKSPLAGNNYAMKFKTSEERQALCQRYIKHLKEGRPKEYFPDADPQTIRRYMHDFPEDFDTESVEQAEREGKNTLLAIGYAGMTGKIPGFNSKTWQFIIQNMTHWKLKTDMTSDGEKIEPLVIYKPELKPEGSQ